MRFRGAGPTKNVPVGSFAAGISAEQFLNDRIGDGGALRAVGTWVFSDATSLPCAAFIAGEEEGTVLMIGPPTL